MVKIIAERQDIVNIANAVRNKTGKINTMNLSEIASSINDINAGADLPELTNEGSASDLFQGKELINSSGSKVTGTFTIDDELTTQDYLITQIQTAVQNKAMGDVNIDEELTTQDNLIAQIQIALNNKINGTQKEV